MTYTINIGKEQVLDVSQSTRSIFTIVCNELESGKRESRFGYFHLLNKEGTIKYKKSTLDFILNDLDKVGEELNLVKCPVASAYIKDMEIGYAYGRKNSYEEWVSNRYKGIGINKRGMFVRIGDEFNFDEKPKYKHFKELKKGNEYFNDFLNLVISHTDGLSHTEKILNNADKIVHGFKSANIVHGSTLEKLGGFVQKAKEEKKAIKIGY